MTRSVVIARAGMFAIVAAFLPAALQRTNPGLVIAAMAMAVLAAAGASIWLHPTAPPARAARRFVSGLLFCATNPAGFRHKPNVKRP